MQGGDNEDYETGRAIDLYWNYYINIEKDMYNTLKYVEPEPDNFKTFSVEFAKIINVACSEIDVLMKEICNAISNDAPFKKKSNNGNIKVYSEIILNIYPMIVECELMISRGKISFKPFEEWTSEESPEFWKAYQNIKHHRKDYFSSANMLNAIYSVGALKVLNLYFIRLNSKNKNCLANRNSDLFLSEYTAELLFMSDNKDLDDFIDLN